MSDKHLSELGWKTLAMKQKVKDTSLNKALAEYAKAPETDPGARLKALEAVSKHATGLRKDNKDNDEVADYLDEVLAEATKSRKTLELLQKQKKPDAKEEEKEAEEDEGSADAAVIKKKMIGLLAQVKTRAPEDKQLEFMAALAPGKSAVLLAKAAGSAQKKVLLELLAGVSSPKFFRGQCIWEENMHTFVLEKVPGGLAKRLTKALLDETGLRYRVRVRSLDGLTVLDSDTDTEEMEGAEQEGEDATPGNLDGASLTDAMTKLGPEIKAALQARPALRDGILEQIKAFQGFIKGEQFGEAREILFALSALVKGTAEQTAATTQPGADDFSKIDFGKIHLEWDADKRLVQDRLETLRQAIVQDYEEGDSEGLEAAENLGLILGRFNEGLGDTLDKMRSAADPTARQTLATQAVGIADRYLEFLATSPLVNHVEANPYEVTIGTQTTLGAPLQQLKSQLQKLA